MYSTREEEAGGLGCFLFFLVFNLVLGGWSVNYLLLLFTGENIPFFWDTVIGLFSGELTIPIAIVLKILQAFGVF